MIVQWRCTYQRINCVSIRQFLRIVGACGPTCLIWLLPLTVMAPILPSGRFLQIYDSLPPEAQRKLVESYLGAVLDNGPRKRAKRVVCSAARFRWRQAATPAIDYRQKKREINALLGELARDAKCSFVKDRSNRALIMAEVIQSIASWLSDMWILVYEHFVQFREAHTSLLFIADVLKKLSDGSRVGGCPCATKACEVDITIRTTAGKDVKHFQFHGCHHITTALLWMWRELFVSMSVSGGRRALGQIPSMLQDIEDALGWRALVRILYGGSYSDGLESDTSEMEGDWEDMEEDEESDDDDEESDEEPTHGGRCICNLHASHWSTEVNQHRLHLRRLVKKYLHSIFSLAPSHDLYCALKDLGSRDLMTTLTKTAPASSDNVAAALEIYAAEADAPSILNLLDQHSYFLRPRDAPILQLASHVLATYPGIRYRTKVITLVEREMAETVHAVAAAVRTTFCHIEDPKHTSELSRILRLPAASSQRAARIEQWVDSVVTPSSGHLHAVAFAAMMMGIPAPVDEGDDADADFLGHLDLDPNDPDLEDIREEMRPPLGERFEGWCEVAGAVKGSAAAALAKVYTKIVEVMPFLRAHDVVEAMQARVSDRPSKRYVSDALAALSSFSKMQRKKIAMKNKKRKQEQDEGPPPLEPMSPVSFSLGAAGFAFSFATAPPPPPPLAGHSSFGGIDDVD
ncbi:hypothetical protein CPB85DRAFT_645393 [Mucidula mucida]|nr:hypothetical protein CPB85DRAFT_645393 [Mucidula mucida]